MIEVGKYNELPILRQTSIGLYLGDDADEVVLLPNKYCPERFSLGDKIRVFVYRDNADRKIATNLTPKIILHQYAFLQVSAVNEVGAFMDWGLEKELLVPYREQRQKMQQGRWYVVYLDLDPDTDRLVGSNRIEKHLQNETLSIHEGDEVKLLVYHRSEIGYSVIINGLHKGLVYSNEVFRQLNVGEALKGYVKLIREDGKVDISLSPIGFASSNDPNMELILTRLNEGEGFLALTDNSPPAEVYELLGISKKAFKKALGTLYKLGRIRMLPDGIAANEAE